MIEKAVRKLVDTQRFYAFLLMQMNRIYSDKVATAGVNITDRINLYINPEFWKTLNLKQQVDILIHEANHIIAGHIERAKTSECSNFKLWNVAADVTINEPLTSLHEIGVTVKTLREQFPDLKIEDGQPTEYYYSIIKEGIENQKKKGNGSGEGELGDQVIDDHDIWEEGDASSDMVKETIKRSLKKAKEAAGTGHTPYEVEVYLDKLSKNQIDWETQLKEFFGRCDKSLKGYSRKRRNRRYGAVFPGEIRLPNTHLAIGIDESGSVCNSLLQKIFTEIDAIKQEYDDRVKLTIIQGDTEVHQVYEYESYDQLKRSSGGGTYYAPIINKATELRVDGMIYLGDGGCFDKNKLVDPKFPFLWVLEEGYRCPVEWGERCYLKRDKRY